MLPSAKQITINIQMYVIIPIEYGQFLKQNLYEIESEGMEEKYKTIWKFLPKITMKTVSPNYRREIISINKYYNDFSVTVYLGLCQHWRVFFYNWCDQCFLPGF